MSCKKYKQTDQQSLRLTGKGGFKKQTKNKQKIDHLAKGVSSTPG
jgi:hypothetical protein